MTPWLRGRGTMASMNKRPEKTKQTKADLRQGFWRLYEKMPIEKITVARVCEEAGYNRATFYTHFRDIYDLLSSIESDMLSKMLMCVERCLKSLSGGKVAKTRAMGEVVLFYETNRTVIGPLLGEQKDPAFIECLKSELKPLWRTYVIGEDTGRSDAEIDLILESALSGSLTMIGQWIRKPASITPTQLARLIYDTAIRDVSKRARA